MYVQKFYCCYCGITKFSDKQFDVSIFPITADVTAAKMTVVWIIKFLEITVLHYSFWSLGHKVGQNNDNKKNNLQKLLCACHNLRFLKFTFSLKIFQKITLFIYKGVKLTNPTSFMALVFSSPYSHALKSLEIMITYNILPKSLEVALVDFSPDWRPYIRYFWRM